MGAYHLTALNVSEYEGHRIAAAKSAELPVHLMESVGLLPDTIGDDHLDVRALRRAGHPQRAGRQGHPPRRAHPRRGRHLRRSHAEPAQPLPQDPPPLRGVRGAAPVPQHRLRSEHRRHLPPVDHRRGHAREAPQRPPRGADRRPRSRGDDGPRAAPHRAGLRGEDRALRGAGAQDPRRERDQRGRERDRSRHARRGPRAARADASRRARPAT